MKVTRSFGWGWVKQVNVVTRPHPLKVAIQTDTPHSRCRHHSELNGFSPFSCFPVGGAMGGVVGGAMAGVGEGSSSNSSMT